VWKSLGCYGLERKNPQEAEIDANTCRKDFTAGEIYEICKFYNEKLSRQTETQFGNNGDTVVQILNDRERPIEVVAKAVHKSTDTVSKINQIFESDCIDIQESREFLRSRLFLSACNNRLS
jgi:hypothetical protein